jgi:hypothetical protein
MKKIYLKPDAEYLNIALKEDIMDTVVDGSWEIGEDDEEGV